MAFAPERLRGLREAKKLSQETLAGLSGLSQSVIAKAEKGKSVPTGDGLDRLALALDCTIDFLFGRGRNFKDFGAAAAQMSFDVFCNRPGFTADQFEQCRRALSHPDAPKTSSGWQSLAEMIALAAGPRPVSTNLRLLRQKASSSA